MCKLTFNEFSFHLLYTWCQTTRLFDVDILIKLWSFEWRAWSWYLLVTKHLEPKNTKVVTWIVDVGSNERLEFLQHTAYVNSHGCLIIYLMTLYGIMDINYRLRLATRINSWGSKNFKKELTTNSWTPTQSWFKS